MGAGVKVLKEGYDVASPYIQQGVDAVTPLAQEAVKVTTEVAGPAIGKAVPLVQVRGRGRCVAAAPIRNGRQAQHTAGG